MSGQQPLDLPADIDPTWKIGIVAAQWHREILQPMIDVAVQTFVDAGIDPKNVTVHDAAGSFEVPLIGAALMNKVDALIGFGILLQGETGHAELIAQSVTQAMMDLQMKHTKPFAFEILHVQTLAQAEARAEGPRNKGFEAARSVLISLAELRKTGL
jgi:6,7-dimethyl-8-ribityllumazine synthase